MNRIKERMMAGLLATTIFAGAILAGGTQLTYEGKTIFESEAKVSFGATYGDRAVKAVVNAKEQSTISVRTEKKPVRVFVNREPLDAGQWNYLDDKGMTTLTVPAGSTSLQFRFDDMATLKPMALVYKVAVDPSPTGGKLTLELKGESVDEKFSGQVAWPEGMAGLYEVSISDNCRLKPINASRVDDKTYYLSKGSALQVDAEALGGKAPDVNVTAKCVGNAVSVKPQNREKLLARKDTVKVEGEAFDRMIGGEVSISKEHKNTSAGGCIYAWGTTGTRLEWDVKVPEAGKYHVVFVAATQETVALRRFIVNGKSVSEAALIAFDGTGGWGRSNPKEWQAFEAAGANGKPVTVEFKAGGNTLALENFCGQHMNLDCIVLYK